MIHVHDPKIRYKIIGPTHTNEGSWLCIEHEHSSPTIALPSQLKIDTYAAESDSVDSVGQQSTQSLTPAEEGSTSQRASSTEKYTETKQDTMTIGSIPMKDLSTPSGSDGDLKEGATCPVCHEDVGPGHSSCTFEEKRYCTNCTAHLKMLRESVNVLATKNGCGPKTSDIHQRLALQSRPPLSKHLPAMLGYLGFLEVDGRWVELSDSKQPDSLEVRLKNALGQLECEGKPIIGMALAKSLGCGDSEIGVLLRALGYKLSNKLDPVSHLRICMKDDDASGDTVMEESEPSPSEIKGVNDTDSQLKQEEDLQRDEEREWGGTLQDTIERTRQER